MTSKNKFRLKYWTSNLMNEMFQVRTIYQYLSDKDHYEEFYTEVWNFLDDGRSSEFEELWSQLKEQTYEEMRTRTMNNYLVYLCSMIDSLLYEVLFLIFQHDKNKIFYLVRMNHIDKANLEKTLGIDLKNLIAAKEQQIDYFLENVSKSAAEICSNGKFEKVFIRISDLTKIDFEQNIIDSFQDVQNKRNDILHERIMFDLEIDDFRERIQSINKFISKIIGYFELKNIPID